MLAIFKEILDYGQTKKAVCNARCPSGTDFVRIVPCGAGAARMCECVLAEVYERCEGLSRRSDVPSRCPCSSSGLRPRLHPVRAVGGAIPGTTHLESCHKSTIVRTAIVIDSGEPATAASAINDRSSYNCALEIGRAHV